MSGDGGRGEAFGGHLRFGRAPALIVVDVVQAYLDPASPLYAPAFGDALPVVARLIAAARSAGIPVIFTRVVYQTGGVDGGQFYRKVPALSVFEEGSPLGAFPADAAPTQGDVVVTKQYASAFFATSLASTLRALAVDTTVIVGFSTSGCVRATALDALQHGFIPFVVCDACADRDAAPHDANLFDLQTKYAEVVDAAAVLSMLYGRATGDAP